MPKASRAGTVSCGPVTHVQAFKRAGLHITGHLLLLERCTTACGSNHLLGQNRQQQTSQQHSHMCLPPVPDTPGRSLLQVQDH